MNGEKIRITKTLHLWFYGFRFESMNINYELHCFVGLLYIEMNACVPITIKLYTANVGKVENEIVIRFGVSEIDKKCCISTKGPFQIICDRWANRKKPTFS